MKDKRSGCRCENVNKGGGWRRGVQVSYYQPIGFRQKAEREKALDGYGKGQGFVGEQRRKTWIYSNYHFCIFTIGASAVH